MAPQRPHPTIAVVAVHGVGDHEPGASAHAVADLLLRQRNPDGSARYTSFGEEKVRLPVRRAATSETPALTPEHALMRGQLERYEGDAGPYDTIRIEGERLSAPRPGRAAEPVAAVHVYEMHWADLSQVGASALRLFAEMYQLLFHLAVVGELALRHAAADLPDEKSRARWAQHERFHSAAVQLLTLAVPTTWLVMLATVLGFLVLGLPDAGRNGLLAGAVGVAAGWGAWWVLYRVPALHARPAWWMAIPAVALAAAWLAWEQASADPHAPHRDAALLVAWFVLATAILLRVFRAYDRVCPGARDTGRVALLGGAIFVVAMVARVAPAVWEGHDLAALGNAVVNAFELETIAVVVVWYLMYACAAIAAFLSWRATRVVMNDRIARALWTARATLALSASSVLVFTFVLWAAVLRASAGFLPAGTPEAIWAPFQQGSYHALFARIMTLTAGAGFPLLLIFLSALATFVAIAFLPAVAREVWPPKAPGSAWDALEREGRDAERLGRWLTSGFGSVARFVTVLFLATFVVQPVASLLGWLPSLPVPVVYDTLDLLEREGGNIIGLLGSLLAATAVGLLALRGRLQRLALGFRPILDAALDVDNWLREHPAADTPRGRIAERYASLLRYLNHWRGTDGQPYQAIVFVAHSQGTVITAEVLGFARRERDREMDGLFAAPPLESASKPDRRLYLFTMGSPLKQLYEACFPYLFGWLGEEARPWGLPKRPAATPVVAGGTHRIRDEEGHVVQALDLDAGAAPAPSDFGLVRWVNAYRTGDYVGRAVWRLDGCAALHRAAPPAAREALAQWPARMPPVVFVSEDAAGTRRELCIGAGAHTHYWDATARAIGLELDLLVTDAAGLPRGGDAEPAVTAPEGPIVTSRTTPVNR
jgi:hypothetical protein